MIFIAAVVIPMVWTYAFCELAWLTKGARWGESGDADRCQ